MRGLSKSVADHNRAHTRGRRRLPGGRITEPRIEKRDVVDDRRHRERVLLEDADERLVIVDAVGAANNGVAARGRIPREAETRLDVVLLECVDRATVRGVDAGLDYPDQRVAVEIDGRTRRIGERRRTRRVCTRQDQK